jgi:hypothetical protein
VLIDLWLAPAGWLGLVLNGLAKLAVMGLLLTVLVLRVLTAAERSDLARAIRARLGRS